MKVVSPDTQNVYTDDHPTGALGLRYLLQGQEGTPDNFMLAYAENLGRFQMVAHRHNFDQFRFTIKGDMTMGPHRTLKEGHLGYFPEGAAYGPQDDGPGPLALVLQFGGASGYGYMSPQQYRAGRDELNKTGHFDGPVYVRKLANGETKKTFSINAIWEQALGAKMLIPSPRYDEAIFMNPKAFRWGQVKGAAGAFRKRLGTFSEREATAEMWMLAANAKIELTADAAIRILFVLNGRGKAGSDTLTLHSAVQLEPGERANVVADEPLTLLSFTLPLVRTESMQAQEPSFEPMPNESVSDAA